MSVGVLNGLTVTEFVEDEEAFNKCVEERFSSLDANGDGVLSRTELFKGYEVFKFLDAESASAEEIGDVFAKFDTDRSGTVDLAEFKTGMREIMVAIARGIGDLPIQVVLDSDSLLMKAVQHESFKSRN